MTTSSCNCYIVGCADSVVRLLAAKNVLSLDILVWNFALSLQISRLSREVSPALCTMGTTFWTSLPGRRGGSSDRTRVAKLTHRRLLGQRLSPGQFGDLRGRTRTLLLQSCLHPLVRGRQSVERRMWPTMSHRSCFVVSS